MGDALIMRVTDVFMSFPLFVLLIVLVSMIGPSQTNVILILGLFSWMVVARLVRGQVLSVMNEPYIEAAIAAGAKGHRIVLRQVLPNAFVPVMVASTLGVANAMLSEAALSFLGLGHPAADAFLGQHAERRAIASGAGQRAVGLDRSRCGDRVDGAEHQLPRRRSARRARSPCEGLIP